MIDKRISRWYLAFLIFWSVNFVEHHKTGWSVIDALMIVWDVYYLVKDEEE